MSESYLGRPLSAREALRRATPYIGRILVCSLLIAFVVGLGFILLFVPGIILAVGLALAIPAVVLEPRSSASARALALVGADAGLALAHLRPAASRCCVLLYVPVVAIGGLFAMLVPQASGDASARRPSRSWPPSRSAGVVQMFIYPLFYCVLTVAYYDLRVRKEGFDLELLASTLLIGVIGPLAGRAPRRPTLPGGARQRVRRAGRTAGPRRRRLLRILREWWRRLGELAGELRRGQSRRVPAVRLRAAGRAGRSCWRTGRGWSGARCGARRRPTPTAPDASRRERRDAAWYLARGRSRRGRGPDGRRAAARLRGPRADAGGQGLLRYHAEQDAGRSAPGRRGSRPSDRERLRALVQGLYAHVFGGRPVRARRLPPLARRAGAGPGMRPRD